MFLLALFLPAIALSHGLPEPALYGAKSCLALPSVQRADMKRALSRPELKGADRDLVAQVAQTAEREAGGRCELPGFFHSISRQVNQLLSYGREHDSLVFGQIDYWQTPAEALRVKVLSTGERVGDCEDFALLKYWIARMAGCPAEKLRIAVVVAGKELHAVLVAEMGHSAIVLDNNPTHDGKAYLATPYSSELKFLVNEEQRFYYCGRSEELSPDTSPRR